MDVIKKYYHQLRMRNEQNGAHQFWLSVPDCDHQVKHVDVMC
jgi:hypothetical protein